MGDLSRHFSRQEIACKCGCGLDSMDKETLKLADECRDFVGNSITPSSGARCLKYNNAPRSKGGVGSNSRSQHPKCRAMDLPVDNPKALYDYLCAKYSGKYGFGLYETFVHVDTRTNGGARW